MGKARYIVCTIDNIECNEKEGYELQQIIYDSEVVHENVSEQIPQILSWTSGGSYSNPPTPPSPQYINKTVPVVLTIPRALMKLNKTAQVLHGD